MWSQVHWFALPIMRSDTYTYKKLTAFRIDEQKFIEMVFRFITNIPQTLSF